jgi:hypothetical protein
MWNRFWFLISAGWMGFCWWMAFTLWHYPPTGPDSFVPDRWQMNDAVTIDFALGFLGPVIWIAGRFVRRGFTISRTSQRQNRSVL